MEIQKSWINTVRVESVYYNTEQTQFPKWNVRAIRMSKWLNVYYVSTRTVLTSVTRSCLLMFSCCYWVSTIYDPSLPICVLSPCQVLGLVFGLCGHCKYIPHLRFGKWRPLPTRSGTNPGCSLPPFILNWFFIMFIMIHLQTLIR